MKKYFTLSSLSLFLFFALIVLVKTVDIGMIGPAETSIGLSTINNAVHEFFGVNYGLYKMTNVMGIASIALGLIFACIGLIQLIKGKSLTKVDGEIIALGCVYVLLGIIYVFFNVVSVNTRPVLMEGEVFPEPSFPSSHTVLIFSILGTFNYIIDKYLKKNITRILKIVSVVLIVFAVAARLVSGVHWFTDILGGVFISFSIIFAYAGVLELFKNK